MIDGVDEILCVEAKMQKVRTKKTHVDTRTGCTARPRKCQTHRVRRMSGMQCFTYFNLVLPARAPDTPFSNPQPTNALPGHYC